MKGLDQRGGRRCEEGDRRCKWCEDSERVGFGGSGRKRVGNVMRFVGEIFRFLTIEVLVSYFR